MATSGELVQAVSDALSVAKETVVVHMRNLREAGLIAIGGRGRAGAKMGATDAARLLLAVGGSNYVKESVNAAISFGQLNASRRELVSPQERSAPVTIGPHWKDGSRHWSVGYPLLADLDGGEVRRRFGLGDVKIGTTFEETLVRLIEAMLAGTLFPPLEPAAFRAPPSHVADYRRRLWVSMYRPEPYGSVTYLAEGITYEKIFFSRSRPDTIYRDAADQPKRAVLYSESDFNEEALAIVCDALRPKKRDGHVSRRPRSKRTKHGANNQPAKPR